MVRITATLLLCAAVPGSIAAAINQSQPNQGSYSLPEYATDPAARAAALKAKSDGWLYGPFLDTPAPYYPAGNLGLAFTQATRLAWNVTQQDPQSMRAQADAQVAAATLIMSGNITKLEDYNKLYYHQWNQSAPKGPWEGMLSNSTSDLLFAMEKLSSSPYSLRRMPTKATLPFAVDEAANITGKSLKQLQADQRLFYIDYSSHKNQTLQRGKYAAACQAYFYIDPKSGDFLPLAIKTNTPGADLTYTPLDSKNDWLLAKMLFNVNDAWNQEFEHFAASHFVSEIAYLAAIRTLSEAHPIMPILHRVMKQAWAMRPAAAERLLFPGGPVDQVFPWSGTAALAYSERLYLSTSSGSFQGNYFERDLQDRGLIGVKDAPQLKSFPYHADASVIVGAIRTFMNAAVKAYYRSDKDIAQDTELQAWIKEAVQAKIIGFPASPLTKCEQLVDMLTHIAYLVSVKHGVSNANSVVASLPLPLHPFSMWAPLPKTKGVKDLVPLLPGVLASVGQVTLEASFNRPTFANSTDNIIHMFAMTDVLPKMDKSVQKAADKFASDMRAFSGKVSSRKFDSKGLCQGMPFIWKALDPNLAAYWLSV